MTINGPQPARSEVWENSVRLSMKHAQAWADFVECNRHRLSSSYSLVEEVFETLQ